MTDVLEHEKQIQEYEKTLRDLKDQNQKNQLWSEGELRELEEKLLALKNKVYNSLTPWQRVTISRHPGRPRSVDYIQAIVQDFAELSGDRLYRDDAALICGLGMIGGEKVMVIAQEKGYDIASRLKRNFGMPHPEGYRKALRCMKLAARFSLPIVCLVDTPGAFAGLAAEERGQGWAIANNLLEMAELPTPILVVLIGEGCSGGALGIAVGDEIAMLEHAYYSVISPEGCASILWKESQKKEIAAAALKIHAEHLIPLGIVDQVIEEPQGGAHYDKEKVYKGVKEFILSSLSRLKQHPLEKLLELRYQRFRKIGKFRVE